MSKAMSPNHREALTVQSSISGQDEYLYSTNHALDVNITSGSGGDVNLIEVGGSSISLGQKTMANSLPITIASDQSPLNVSTTPSLNTVNPSVNITARDTSSTTITGAYGQPITTGTPTANSTAVVNNLEAELGVSITISGTWTGTLNFERSSDNGTTWVPSPVYVSGGNYVVTSTSANGVYKGSVATGTNYRVRSVTAMTGTAVVQITDGEANFAVFTVNPQGIWDQVSGSVATVKPASTSSVATDTSLVVGLSPNSNSVNTATIAGTATATGNGTTNAGTQRVTISSDSTGQIKLATGANTIGAISNTSFIATQATGTNLHTVVDSGSITANPPALPSSMVSGQQTATGTAAALPSGSLVNGVIVQALSTNTASVYVGKTGVTTSTGFELQPGQATSVAVSNLNAVFIVGNTQGVCWIGS